MLISVRIQTIHSHTRTHNFSSVGWCRCPKWKIWKYWHIHHTLFTWILFSDLHFKSYFECTMHTHTHSSQTCCQNREHNETYTTKICRHKIPMVLWCLWHLLYLRNITRIYLLKKKNGNICLDCHHGLISLWLELRSTWKPSTHRIHAIRYFQYYNL